ncbi:uncharacterized protein LOC122364073 [Amphibalanus amphitrite]|uniref:uncharacterized protein LOC122364073 n=1 Tax=Amphibalanus amphitrite TaxID=1232801 RepID=UPI001C90E6A6|nr:uncharacterized protein LOC122364073 [Amphibalanus amphitrite]
MAAASAAVREGRALRRLGTQETMWHELFTRRAGTSLLQYSLLLRSERPLQADTVRDALADLQRQLPLLRARVAPVEGVHHLVAGPCPDVPLSVLPPADDWLAEHHRQLREQTIDPAAGPLWKATLLPGRAERPPHRAALFLSLCHTITDGISNGLICRRLVAALAQAAAGRPLGDTPPAAVSPPVEQLLRSERLPLRPAVLGELARALSVVLSRRRHPFLERFVAPFDPSVSYCNRTVPAALSAEETAALRAQCRRHGVSVNSALSAAVSVATGRLLGGPCPPLPTMWLVSAHRYLAPDEGRQLSAAAGALGTVSLDGDGLWTVAGRVGAALERQLQLRLPLLPMKLLGRFMTPERIVAGMEKSASASNGSKFVYNINNLGVMDGAAAAGEDGAPVRLEELHRAFRAHPAMDASFGSHCFHTVSGRLCYDLNYLRGRVREEDALRLAGMVLQLLREAAASGRRG